MLHISRVTKDPQVRQAELMDTALELFLSLGYQKTTVQDIVKKIQVAQGTFYYYFASKEAILEAIFARYVTEMIQEVQLSHSETAAALEKLQLFINLFYKLCYSNESGLIAKLLYKENQGLLINKLWRQMHIITNPLLVRLLIDCNAAGVTNVIHPEETLSFFAGIMGALLEASSPQEYGHETDPVAVRNKRRLAEQLLENLFGMVAGSLHLAEQ